MIRKLIGHIRGLDQSADVLVSIMLRRIPPTTVSGVVHGRTQQQKVVFDALRSKIQRMGLGIVGKNALRYRLARKMRQSGYCAEVIQDCLNHIMRL